MIVKLGALRALVPRPEAHVSPAKQLQVEHDPVAGMYGSLMLGDSLTDDEDSGHMKSAATDSAHFPTQESHIPPLGDPSRYEWASQSGGTVERTVLLFGLQVLMVSSDPNLLQRGQDSHGTPKSAIDSASPPQTSLETLDHGSEGNGLVMLEPGETCKTLLCFPIDDKGKVQPSYMASTSQDHEAALSPAPSSSSHDGSGTGTDLSLDGMDGVSFVAHQAAPFFSPQYGDSSEWEKALHSEGGACVVARISLHTSKSQPRP